MIGQKVRNIMMDFIPTVSDNSLIGDNYIKNSGLFDPSINEYEGGFYQLQITSSNSPNPKSSVTLSNKIDITYFNCKCYVNIKQFL